MIIFPDSNIFLHFKQLNDFDWEKITGSKDPVIIIITAVVIQEVDKHKYNAKPYIADRAQRSLKWMEDQSGEQTSNRFSVELDQSNTPPDVFKTFLLEQAIPDDQLIAAILSYRDNHAAEKILLLSNDTGPRLKARKHSVEVITPDPSYQLRSEKNPLEKENRELKLQIEKLRNAHPKLLVSFPGRELFIKKVFALPVAATNVHIDSELNKLKDEYPLLEMIDPYNMPALLIPAFNIVDNEKRKSYNTELEAYYKEYRKFIRYSETLKIRRALSLAISFDIHNDGNAPAEDVEVILQFPENIIIENEKEHKKRPKEPYLPTDPTSLAYSSLLSSMGRTRSNAYSTSNPFVAFDSGVEIKTAGSLYSASQWLKKLIHGYSHNSNTFYVVLDDQSKLKNFAIDYIIRSASLPEPVRGKLNVVIEIATAS